MTPVDGCRSREVVNKRELQRGRGTNSAPPPAAPPPDTLTSGRRAASFCERVRRSKITHAEPEVSMASRQFVLTTSTRRLVARRLVTCDLRNRSSSTYSVYKLHTSHHRLATPYSLIRSRTATVTMIYRQLHIYSAKLTIHFFSQYFNYYI